MPAVANLIMPVLSRWGRRLVLSAALAARLAHGETMVYEGDLVPSNLDPIMTIKLTISQEGDKVTGSGALFFPAESKVSVDGSRISDHCIFSLWTSDRAGTRLEGTCTEKEFNGSYKRFSSEGRRLGRGLFRIRIKTEKQEKTEQEAQKGPEKRGPERATISRCLNKKASCLIACPRGDANQEFMCSNTCRRRYQSCVKGQNKGFSFKALPPNTLPE